ncbi:MAG: argininosuccinate lyase [Planctomycetota bacterium]
MSSGSDNSGGKLWGGRFAGAVDPAFDAFNRSLPFDQRLWVQDVVGSIGWARALARAGVLTADECERMVGALGELRRDLERDPSALHTSTAEDVHSFVESELQRRVGALARKLHSGRSRNDQVATDLRLWCKGALADLGAGVRDAIAALVELASAHADVALPGYTHLQRAQPITAGHHALAYVEMLARDAGRLRDARRRLDVSPLGCGALAGTAFPIDRADLAADLGFAAAAHNSLDAVSDRDFAAEIAFACSLLMAHLSRLAEDWIFFCSHEAGFLTLTDAVASGSSLMPQKKNPDALELMRGKTGRVYGTLHTLLVALKGIPLAYDKDLQEDKEALFAAVDQTGACLAMAALVARNASYDRERCAAAAAAGYMNATDLADLLVRAGVPFRDAHERAGRVVRAALERQVEIEGLPAAVVRELLPELDVDLAHELSVASVLARRSTLGGTAPERVRAEVARWRSILADERGLEALP